jgi:hypothetical protein
MQHDLQHCTGWSSKAVIQRVSGCRLNSCPLNAALSLCAQCLFWHLNMHPDIVCSTSRQQHHAEPQFACCLLCWHSLLINYCPAGAKTARTSQTASTVQQQPLQRLQQVRPV